MRALATELGIKAPSLYKHVDGKGELEAALISDGLISQAEAYEKAVTDGDDPTLSIANAYRRWAHEHRHLYALMNSGPIPRDRIPDEVSERPVAAVLDAFGGNRELARAAWAFAHGMITLELADRFPPEADLDQTWHTGITAITQAVAQREDH